MKAISPQELIDFTYMLAAVGFILALKWLSSPVSAMRGVLIGESRLGRGGRGPAVRSPGQRRIPMDPQSP